MTWGGWGFKGQVLTSFIFSKKGWCQLESASDLGLFGGTLLDTWNAECYADWRLTLNGIGIGVVQKGGLAKKWKHQDEDTLGTALIPDKATLFLAGQPMAVGMAGFNRNAMKCLKPWRFAQTPKIAAFWRSCFCQSIILSNPRKISRVFPKNIGQFESKEAPSTLQIMYFMDLVQTQK